MDQRLDLITVGVPDVDVARAFYLDGLGWSATFDLPGEILFLQVGRGLLLGLWGEEKLRADAGGPPGEVGATDSRSASLASTRTALALAHNVESRAEVDEVLASAERAGATVLKRGQYADFGGYHGYFTDPVGLRWEVAHNPGWSVTDDGTVQLRALPPA